MDDFEATEEVGGPGEFEGGAAGGTIEAGVDFDLDFDTDEDFELSPRLSEGKSRRVLVVDDEVHILKAVQRLFIGHQFEVMTAEDGQQALEVMEQESVAVIVSDQRMPGISGTELLRQVRLKYPKTVRIMLTGNNDVSTAIDAINDGAVFRFVTKPWDHDNFLRIIELAMEHYDLLHSKERYEGHIEAQNEKLRKLNLELRNFNERLEGRVAERTEEVETQKQEISRLYGELQDSFDGMIKALLCIMELGEIHVAEHCQRTAERARRFGERLDLGAEDIRELERAAMLHWIGLINASASFFRKPVDEFDAVDEATWEFHPLLSQQAIRHVPALYKPGRIILHYLRRYDDPSFSPGRPSADEGDTPLSESFIQKCQILAICSAFEQARTANAGAFGGRKDWSKISQAGLEVVRGRSGGAFDPRLVEHFEEMMGNELSSSRTKEMVVTFEELEPGMVLSRPLETAQGTPVAPRDMTITEELLDRLRRFRDSKGLNEIHIWG